MNRIRKFVTQNSICLKASYTVEASFVIPIVCFLLFTVMTLTFYLHDIIATEANEARVAEQTRMALLYSKIPNEPEIFENGFDSEEGKIVLDSLISVSQKEANDITYFAQVEKYNTSYEDDVISTKTKLSGEKRWYMLLPGEFSKRTIGEYRNNTSPAKNLRLSRLIYRIWNEIKPRKDE